MGCFAKESYGTLDEEASFRVFVANLNGSEVQPQEKGIAL
jgi:hypothetical protein